MKVLQHNLSVFFLLLGVLFLIPVVSAAEGCFLYIESPFYCTMLSSADAEIECSLYDSCQFDQSFSNQSCSTYEQCSTLVPPAEITAEEQTIPPPQSSASAFNNWWVVLLIGAILFFLLIFLFRLALHILAHSSFTLPSASRENLWYRFLIPRSAIPKHIKKAKQHFLRKRQEQRHTLELANAGLSHINQRESGALKKLQTFSRLITKRKLTIPMRTKRLFQKLKKKL